MGLKGFALGGIIGSIIENMIIADRNGTKVEQINIQALNKVGEAQYKQTIQQEKVATSLRRLTNRKKGIILTSMKQFLDIYEQIMSINFVEGEGIKELDISNFTIQSIAEIKTMLAIVGEPLTTTQTLATMIVRGGISGLIAKESEMNVEAAKMRVNQADIIVSQSKTVCASLDAIYQRSERLTEVLTKLNMLFLKSIDKTSTIIKKNGCERKNYSTYERDCIRTCINMASSVKGILDTPLLDTDGEVTIQSLEAIKLGEQYLNRIAEELNF